LAADGCIKGAERTAETLLPLELFPIVVPVSNKLLILGVMRVKARVVEADIELAMILEDCIELIWDRGGSIDGIDAVRQISSGTGSD
jgi:hypothetical protein